MNAFNNAHSMRGSAKCRVVKADGWQWRFMETPSDSQRWVRQHAPRVCGTGLLIATMTLTVGVRSPRMSPDPLAGWHRSEQ